MTKIYQKSYLLGQDTSKRVELINSFDFDNYDLAYTKITEDSEFYYYHQTHYKKKSLKIKIDEIKSLANTLTYLNNLGYIHGDINRKNILYTDEGFKIIDFEPSLIQLKNNKKVYMITPPYFIKDNPISFLTDKIGFFYFLLRITKKITSKDVVYLAKTFNHHKYLPNLENFTYFDIVDYIFYSPKTFLI